MGLINLLNRIQDSICKEERDYNQHEITNSANEMDIMTKNMPGLINDTHSKRKKNDIPDYFAIEWTIQ